MRHRCGRPPLKPCVQGRSPLAGVLGAQLGHLFGQPRVIRALFPRVVVAVDAWRWRQGAMLLAGFKAKLASDGSSIKDPHFEESIAIEQQEIKHVAASGGKTPLARLPQVGGRGRRAVEALAVEERRRREEVGEADAKLRALRSRSVAREAWPAVLRLGRHRGTAAGHVRGHPID